MLAGAGSGAPRSSQWRALSPEGAGMKRKRGSIVVAGLIAILAGCSGGDNAGTSFTKVPVFQGPTSSRSSTAQQLPFQTITDGYVGVGSHGPGVYVLRSTADFTAFWNACFSTGSNIPSPPSVDFTENVVVADVEMIGGDVSLSITGVKASGDGVVIQVSQQVPGPTCITPQYVTVQGQIISVPIFAGNATVEKTTTTSACY